MITACFNVALNFVLIPIMSYDGTSLTTVLSEFLSMSLNLYWSFDIVKDIMVVKDNQKAIRQTEFLIQSAGWLLSLKCRR